MRTAWESFGKLRLLIGSQRRWRWWVMIVFALAVTGLEVVGASLVYLLVGLVTAPDTPVVIPGIGDLSALLPALDGDQLRIAVALAVLVFFGVRAGAVIVQAYVNGRLTANAGAVVAERLLRGYLAMPYVIHTQRSSAELIRNTYDATQQMVSQTLKPLIQLVSQGLVTLGLVTVVLVAEPFAALLAAVVLLPALWLVQARIQPRLKRLSRRSQQARTGSLQAVQQSLGAIRDIKLLDRAEDFALTFARQRFRLARSGYLAGTLKQLPTTLIESTLIAIIVAVFIAAIVTGTATQEVLATLSLFAYAGLRLQPALQKLTQAINTLRFGSAILDDLVADSEQLQAWQAEEQASLAAAEQREDAPFTDLRLERVTFAYAPDAVPALREVSLTVGAGEFVGICGPTGGGKSTLVDVLTGLLRPGQGVVRVNGAVLDARPVWWWRQLGVVSQQVFLLDDTLRANIAFGETAGEVDEDRLARCVRRAQLDEVVAGLPDGLATVVGERGIRLSGGQRQRVAIARALYREPAVLILDEGTSALDGATEAALVAALDELQAGRTIIAVAHRLTTLRDADRILVVADGRIVDEGRHADLLARSDLFRSLAG